MPKKLTSVRISEDILEKIDILKGNRSLQIRIQRNYSFYSRESKILDRGYYDELSTADVIEVALLELFNKYEIWLCNTFPGSVIHNQMDL